MTWIDDRIESQKQSQARRDKIYTEADGLFETLRQEIAAMVAEASKKGLPSKCEKGPDDANGRPSIRITKAAVAGQSRLPTLDVKLSKDKSAIEINPSRIKLAVEVCDTGICVKHDGQQISIANAAERILDPFFFPPEKS